MSHEGDVVVCTLHYGSVLCVSATMGFKHRELDPAPLLKALARPNFMIKIIPHVDCTPRICELVRYHAVDVTLKGAWAGPAALQLFDHALCDVAQNRRQFQLFDARPRNPCTTTASPRCFIRCSCWRTHRSLTPIFWAASR